MLFLGFLAFSLFSSISAVPAQREGTVHCPNSFELVQKKGGAICVKIVTRKLKFVCGDDFSKFRRNGEVFCKKRIVTPSEIRCPEGYEIQINGKCERRVERAPVESCPKGFQLSDDGKKCVKEEKYPANRSCPDGQELLDNGNCLLEQKLPLQYRCDEGKLVKENQCEIRELIDPDSRCPRGAPPRADGKCVQTLFEEVQYTCPKPTNLIGHKQCAELSEPNKICPARHTPNDGCFKIDLEHATPMCPDGWKMFRRDDYHLCVKCADRYCRRKYIKKATYTCPEGYRPTNSNGRQCYKKIPVDYKLTCPKGQTLIKTANDGYKCRGEVTDAIASCPSAGFHLKDGKCVKETVVPKESFCPPEFTLRRDINKCERITLKPATPFCPHPHHKDDEPEMSVPTFCYVRKEKPAILTCERKDDILKGEYCWRLITSTPIDSCPADGFELEDDVCVKILSQNPERICPDGLKKIQKGKACLQLIIKDAEVTCPDGFKQVEKHCQKRITKAPNFHKH